MNTITIYILECEHGKYYIGKTNNVDNRIVSHFKNNGSEWTKLHKPINIIETHENCDDFDEDKYTLKMMDKYGINNVRGGSFSRIKLEDNELQTISRMLNNANNKCYLCEKTSHFVSQCPEKNRDRNGWVSDGKVNYDTGNSRSEIKTNICPGCNTNTSDLYNHKKDCDAFWKLDNTDSKYHKICQDLSLEKYFVWLLNKQLETVYLYTINHHLGNQKQLFLEPLDKLKYELLNKKRATLYYEDDLICIYTK